MCEAHPPPRRAELVRILESDIQYSRGEHEDMEIMAVKFFWTSRGKNLLIEISPILRKSMERSEHLKTILEKANQKRDDGEYSAALGILDGIIQEADKYQEETTLISFYTLSATCCMHLRELERAFRFVEDGMELSQKLEYKRGIALCLYVKGSIQGTKGEIIAAEKTAAQALEVLNETDNESLRAATINLIAVTSSYQGNFIKAMEYAIRYLNITSEFKQTKRLKYQIATTLSNLSGFYYNLGELDHALERGLEAYQLCRELENPLMIISACVNVGLVMLSLGEPYQSLQYHRKAWKLLRKCNDEKRMAISFLNIGLIYKNNKRPKRAMRYFEKSLEKKLAIDERFGMPTLYQNMALVHKEFYADYGKALELLNKSLHLSYEYNLVNERPAILQYLGETLMCSGNLTEAQRYFEDALALAKEQDNTLRQMEILLDFSECWEACGEYRNAFETMKEWSTLSKKQFDTEKTRAIAVMRIHHEIEQKEQDAKLARQETDLARKDAEIYRIKTEELEMRVQQELERRQEQQRIIIQKSKLESLGQLAAGIAHEVNQPLTRITMGLDNLLFTDRLGKLNNEFTVLKTRQFLKETERIKLIIDHIKTFSRDQQLTTYEKVDLNHVVKNTLLLFNEQYRKHGLDVVLDLLEPLPPVIGHPLKLEQVLLNLIANARDATEEKERDTGVLDYKKRITISTAMEAKSIVLKVEDNGSGIEPEYIDMIFDPFFTKKKDGKGTGLGLPVCYGIIKEFEGEITVNSTPGEGTIMKIALPQTQA